MKFALPTLLSAGRLTQPRVLLSLVLFAIIPTIFLVSALQLTKANGPQWLGTNFENSYAYLFNSLLLTQGLTPYHTDHPGTTTQLFGAICLLLSGNGTGDQLVRAVIDHPEAFIKTIQRALLVLGTASLWLCPWHAARRWGNWVAGLLLQLPFLFFYTVLTSCTWLDSELMLIALSAAALSLCFILLREKDALSFRAEITLGAICGLGLATKLTFFPFILIGAVSCRGLKSLVVFAGSLLVAALIALIPIFPEWPRVFQWFTGMATHSGYYGTGSVGFVRLDRFPAEIVRLISGEPMLGLIPIIATLAILIVAGYESVRRAELAGFADPVGRAKFHLGLVQPVTSSAVRIFIAQVIAFLLILKHGNYHYLIPICLSTGLNLALLHEDIWRRPGIPVPKIFGGLTIAILVFLGVSSFRVRIPGAYVWLRDHRIQQLQLYARAKQMTQNSIRVDYYRSDSPEFALYFGNFYARRAFAKVLQEKFPNALFYNIFFGEFETFDRWVEPDSVRSQYDRLYFFGNELTQISSYGPVHSFEPQNLTVIDRAGDYLLQEWVKR